MILTTTHVFCFIIPTVIVVIAVRIIIASVAIVIILILAAARILVMIAVVMKNVLLMLLVAGCSWTEERYLDSRARSKSPALSVQSKLCHCSGLIQDVLRR